MTTPDGPPVALAWPPRPPRRVAGIPVGLLVCWQAALLLALLAVDRPTGQVIVLAATAAALVAVTGLRLRGRWTHEWVVLWLRYLLRERARPTPGEPPELAVLRLAARAESIEEIEIEGRDVAMIVHGLGCTAVLEIEPGPGLAELSRLPLTVAPRYEPDAPAVTLQLLVYTLPGAGARTWLAVQVRREAGYETGELRGVLVSAVRRLQRRLRSEDVGAQPLDRTRLVAALHTLTGLELTLPPPPGTAAGPVGREGWAAWWTRGVPQASLALRDWPGLPDPPEPALFEVLLGTACPQTVSVAARRLRLPSAHGTVRAGAEVLGYEVTARLAERDQHQLDAAVRHLRDRLAAAGASADRLDGQQLPGLAATLPLGGFLPGYAPATAAFAPPPKLAQPRPVQSAPGPRLPGRAPAPAVAPAPALAAAPAVPPPPVAPPPPPGSGPGSPPVPPPPPSAPAAGAAAVTPRGVVRPPEPPAEPVAAPEPAPEPVRTDEPVPAPAPEPASAPPASPAPTGIPAPIEMRPLFPSRDDGEVRAPSAPVRGQARVPAPQPPAEPEPVRARAAVPRLYRGTGAAPEQPTTGSMPAVLRGVASPPPPLPPPPGPPAAGTGVPPPPLLAPPAGGATPAAAADPPAGPAAGTQAAVRAYGASVSTGDLARRSQVEELVALVRTPHPSPQVVAVVAGKEGLGASTTAAGLARTLATVREDYTALLDVKADPVDAATIREICREHAFAVVDLGAHTGPEAPQALAVSSRLVVVSGAGRRATPAAQLILDRVNQVNPALVADPVIAVVCKTGRQYQRVLRDLSEDPSPQAAQIIPIPPDPALDTMDDMDLARLRPATREAYLRLAAAMAAPRSAGAAGQPPGPTR